jgi:hypothetical protein
MLYLAFPWLSYSYLLHNLITLLIWNYFELNWPRTPTELKTRTETGFIWNSLYNLGTDHTENISTSIVETCVLSHCIATVAALTIANPLLLRYPATTSKRVLLLLFAFRGFYGFNSCRLGETHHNIDLSSHLFLVPCTGPHSFTSQKTLSSNTELFNLFEVLIQPVFQTYIL